MFIKGLKLEINTKIFACLVSSQSLVECYIKIRSWFLSRLFYFFIVNTSMHDFKNGQTRVKLWVLWFLNLTTQSQLLMNLGKTSFENIMGTGENPDNRTMHSILFSPLPHNDTFLPLGNKPFENTVGKGEIARNEQFFLFPQCFLPVWIAFCHFRQIWNCCLQTLSVWSSLKFVVW